MAEGVLISSSMATIWLPWLLLGALVSVGISSLMQPRYLHGLISNSTQSFTLNIAEQIPSIGAQTGQWVLNIVVAATCAYICIDAGGYGTPKFGMLIGRAAAIDVFRLVAAIIVSYTFDQTRLFGAAYIRYFSLRSLYTIVLLVPTLMLFNLHAVTAMLTVIVVLTAVYYIALTVQWSRMFCTSLLDVLFLLMYIVTVEILPTTILFIL